MVYTLSKIQEGLIMNESSLLPTLLLVLFIALKLTHVINWSWWWVLSPFWIPLCAVLIIGVLYLVYVMGKKVCG